MPAKTEVIIAQQSSPSLATLSPARQALKDAIESVQRVEGLELFAADFERTAASDVQKAHSDVAQFNGIEEDLVANRVATLKGETPAKSVEELKDAQRRRGLAHEELSVAGQAHRVARESLDATRETLVRERKVVESRAIGVLSERVAEVVAMFQQVSAQQITLRTILRGLLLTPGWEMVSEPSRTNIIQNTVAQCGLPLGQVGDWQKLMGQLALGMNVQFNPDPATGISRATAYWKSVADAAIADPAADPEPLPSVDDLWK